MKKSRFALAGMIVGLVMALFGLLVLTGLFTDTSSPGFAPATYDSGYATFGADYYNFVCNNTAETASAARTTAQNVRGIGDLLTAVCGIFLTGFGLLALCHFGMLYCDLRPPKAVPAPAAAFVQEPMPEAAPEGPQEVPPTPES